MLGQFANGHGFKEDMPEDPLPTLGDDPLTGKSRNGDGVETGTQLESMTSCVPISSPWVAGPPDEWHAPTSLARRPLNPLVFAERSAPLDAYPHAPEFLRAQRRIHAIGPIHGAFHRPRR